MNRFTKLVADRKRLDGWLDKEQADKLKAQLEEARWLLVHCPNCMDPDQAVLKEWWQRRDTLLEQLKGGL